MSDDGGITVGERLARIEEEMKNHGKEDAIIFHRLWESIEKMRESIIESKVKLVLLMGGAFFVASVLSTIAVKKLFSEDIPHTSGIELSAMHKGN